MNKVKVRAVTARSRSRGQAGKQDELGIELEHISWPLGTAFT